MPGPLAGAEDSQIAAFMAVLDVSIVNVALPSIQRDPNMARASAQWVVCGYAFAGRTP